MERSNNLSSNLKAYQQLKNQSLAEFSKTLSIPKSTLQSVMMDGNTTLDTLIHLADALHITLDQLVFGADLCKNPDIIHWLLAGASWYAERPPELQEKLRYHINAILTLMCKEES